MSTLFFDACSVLIFSDFCFGFSPIEIASFSMSSPSVKAVFSCQIYPGYSPINCLSGSLISFIYYFSSWRGTLLWETIGFKQLCSCLLFCPSAYWKISSCLAAACLLASALPVTNFLISNLMYSRFLELLLKPSVDFVCLISCFYSLTPCIIIN